ncbi:hypothetical protein ACGFNY_45290 [Streptomyces chartreusis]|uniref:hypothetical protein n=1 Tax=Streptomyces chartreusis TaxID=1969 RepID=UPI003718BFCA
MPAPVSFTPRQLGQIASRLDGFTEARRANDKMGVPSTPDRFVCRFPCGHTGTVVWEQAPLSKGAAARNGGKPVYRYVVYLDAAQRTDVCADLPVGTLVQSDIRESLAAQQAQRERLVGDVKG